MQNHDTTSPADADDPVARLTSEGPIGMTAASKFFGTYRAGKPTCPTTVTRHALRGVRLPDGRLVRLESFRLSGRLYTSRAAILRFIRAQNVPPADPPPAPVGPAGRTRRAADAARQLDTLGL